MTDHVRLNFNLVEGLAIIDTEDGSNHLGNDDHVTEMGAHGLRLLTSSLSGLLGLTELLDEAEALAVKSTLESAIYQWMERTMRIFDHTIRTFAGIK